MFAIKALKKGDIVARDEVDRYSLKALSQTPPLSGHFGVMWWLSFLLSLPVWCARRGSLKRSTASVTRSWSTCLRVSRRRSTFALWWSTRLEATWWCTSTLMFSLSPGLCECLVNVWAGPQTLTVARRLNLLCFLYLFAGFMQPALFWDYSFYMTIRLCTGKAWEI